MKIPICLRLLHSSKYIHTVYTMVCLNTPFWLAGSCAFKSFNAQVDLSQFNFHWSTHLTHTQRSEIALHTQQKYVVNAALPHFSLKSFNAQLAIHIYIYIHYKMTDLIGAQELRDTTDGWKRKFPIIIHNHIPNIKKNQPIRQTW